MPDGVTVSRELLISWDFYTHQFLEITESDVKSKKDPAISGSVGEKSLSMRKFGGELKEWFRLTENEVTEKNTHYNSTA